MSHAPALPEWSLAELRRILWLRRWLMLAITVEIVLVAGLVTFLQTPKYRASARVLIERSMPKVLESEDVVPVVWNEFEIQRFYQTQYFLLRDAAVLRDAVGRPGVRPALVASMSGRADGDDGPGAPSDRELAVWLRGQIEIEQQEYSNVVEVSFLHEDPDVAATVVNATVEAYRDFFVSSGIDARQGASQFLEERIEEAQADVLQLERRLATLRADIRAVLPTGDAEMGTSRLESLDRTLTEAKARRATLEARVAAWNAARPRDLAGVSEDPRVRYAREDLRAIESELRGLEGRAGDAWPRVRELRDAARAARRALDEATTTVYEEALGTARAELSVAREEATRLAALFERELTHASAARVDASDFESLRALYEQKKLALDRLLERREEVALSVDLENVLRRQITLLDQAAPPQRPAVPRVRLNMLLGLLFGLVCGVGATFVAETLDNKVRTPDQLQSVAALPIIGCVPRVDPAESSLMRVRRRSPGTTPLLADSEHGVEEAFRAIRSALLLARPDHAPRTLLVTSALPGEGKSTVAANLGRTLASFGQRVALVDADLRHPRLHRVFGASPERGLTNALAESGADLAELIVPTRYENLWLLPGGPCPPDPATLLDGARVNRILGEMQGEIGFDTIILDTPPLLVFADAFNLVPLVEGTLVVARAMKTPKDAIAKAVDSLRKMNANVIGAILNGEESEDRSGSYYRYYHYRKGSYAPVAVESGASLTTKPPAPVEPARDRPGRPVGV